MMRVDQNKKKKMQCDGFGSAKLHANCHLDFVLLTNMCTHTHTDTLNDLNLSNLYLPACS